MSIQWYLYLFAGFPRQGLNAGGLQYTIETLENLAIIEHDPTIQLRKDGVYRVNDEQQGEWIDDFTLVMSPNFPIGFTWKWFIDPTPEGIATFFGNGVSIASTKVLYETKIVIHPTGLTERELLATGKVVDLSRKQLVGADTDAWQEYERRWEPGTCPQRNHILTYTKIVTQHRLPQFAYDRVMDLVEGGAEVDHRRYNGDEVHFSSIRKWDGKVGFGRIGSINDISLHP